MSGKYERDATSCSLVVTKHRQFQRRFAFNPILRGTQVIGERRISTAC